VNAPSAGRRTTLTVLLGSLLVQLAAVALMTVLDAHPVYDEYLYDRRADGWAALLGDPGSAEHRATVYDDGFQPPLHPLLLGLVRATGLPGPLSGRVLSALWTALATLFVYRITRRLAGETAARFAAGLHAFYPTVVFFAASLWAEPLYVLLLLAAVDAALAARTGRLRPAALCGLALGGLLLTRSAGLPYLIVLPLALLGPPRCWPGRRRAALLVVAVAVLTTLPWEVALWRNEGRPHLLATSAGFNLALGNNPHVVPGAGSTWLDPVARADLEREIDRVQREWRTDRPAAWLIYALDRIEENPRLALRRAVDRLRLLGSADLFPLRHVLQATVRPLSPWLAGVLWAGGFLCYLVWACLVLRGVFLGGLEHGRFLLLLAAAGAVGPMLTVSFARLHLPLLVLLLPFAGLALARFRERIPLRRRVGLAASAGLVAWAAATSLPIQIERQLAPSAWYRTVVGPVARAVGAEPRYGDQVLVSGSGRPLLLEGGPGETIRLGPSGSETLHVFTGEPHTRGRLILSTRDGLRNVVIDPLDASMWWEWKQLAEHGLPVWKVRWQGGAPASPNRPRTESGAP
jgi:4-amino-4-deoxy-L-arabinose transferase-like glycosyltransferase